MRQVLHRGLRAASVMVTERGVGGWTYKVSGFHFARQMNILASADEAPYMTQIGVPKWTAPEVFSPPYFAYKAEHNMDSLHTKHY